MLYRSWLFIRSVLFYLAYYGSGVIYGTFSVIVWGLHLPYSVRWRLINPWTHLVMFFLRAICGVRVEIRGDYHKDAQPFVIMCKHQSTFETLFLQCHFGPVSTILKKELLRIPFFGWGLSALKPIAIDRSNPRQALRDVRKKGVSRLEEGINVMIFPEGTRMRPGEVGNYARSGADIAISAGRPVLPVAHNAGRHWPARNFILQPGTITVIVGEPISCEGKDNKQVTEEAKAWIEAHMLEINDG
ncbi:lysophospholipid acyltransferase family protein [Marinimicrobium alkaliphilum]|uniref:lysophospholipid acyltransferase family protein n=1 Tax=Marinimicrobium alkaliphilum TaxID=2202654 RepID=UPI001E40116C|nr:lysophospholipid acyltransferase family protein [Marinimicrobium alkaliphilum]